MNRIGLHGSGPWRIRDVQSRPKTNGMAVASFVLGLVWAFGIGSILALVFGYMARSQIRASQGQETGLGLATAGIVLGWIGVAGAVFVFQVALG
jgi:hypothetical protein